LALELPRRDAVGAGGHRTGRPEPDGERMPVRRQTGAGTR
jgi:hypothetical protein